VIPAIAPGASESISLFLPFRESGPVRIEAEVEWQGDTLNIDNVRRIVAVIRDHVSVLCVEGSPDGTAGASGSLLAAALGSKSSREAKEDLSVQSVSWVDLPAQDLEAFDVVILSNVPDITMQQANILEQYVREGNGLIWFGGEYVKANVWNQRIASEGTPLLPAVIQERLKTSDPMGIGRSLDPSLSDHPVCRPLFSLPEDLLSETRFHTLLRVDPVSTGVKVLTLAGSDEPVLLEQALGRGYVFMFTTSAGTDWNNMAVTPVFPMLLQQMVTYLTSRKFETPRLVGESLALTYKDQPDASEAVFDTPSGDTLSVPVQAYQDQYVALLDGAREAGFYMARVSLQSEGMPVAVNVDTQESSIANMPDESIVKIMKGTGVSVLDEDMSIEDIAIDSRRVRSYWRILMYAALFFLVVESLLAERMYNHSLTRNRTGEGDVGV
jgi:hypothetical protein